MTRLLKITCGIFFIIAIFSNLQANVRMGIASDSRYCGEREVAWRIKIAAESLGWTVFLDEDKGSQLQAIPDLDWVICLLPLNDYFVPHCPNYLTIFHPFNYLDDDRNLIPFYEKYDGYLLTIHDRETLENCLRLKNKEFNYIPFYPTLHTVPYVEVTLNNLVTSIPVWGNRLSDAKFQKFYNLLSRTGFIKFYGIKPNRHIIDQGYIGKIPFDGVSVIEVLQKYGITLVMHSDIHNQERIPTSRIFEAAAASTVIISDENPFVKQHFGDSVFYIDTTLSATKMFEQVQNHLNTIYLNPKKALEMAKNAHQIYLDHFEMSNQLLNLESLHHKILHADD